MIRVRSLTVEFPASAGQMRRVLDQVDLEVAPGELVVLNGVSGSGKTTLLSVVGGLLRPTSGAVEVQGRAVAKLTDTSAAAYRRDTLGFLFQQNYLFDRMSVLDNVALPLVAAGWSPGRIRTRVTETLATVGASAVVDRTIAELSGGERQRCALARALVARPRLLLCDEPTANLDAAGRELLLDLLDERKSSGVTILLATHDPLFDSAPHVDRVVRLEDGRVVTT